MKRQGPATPNAGIGVPAPGGSRLLALRTADPQGGPPWGMRLVHTTRGEICVQIGRLADGQLGQLGIDGAFHDDGRFHPLAPDILPKPATAATSAATPPRRSGSASGRAGTATRPRTGRKKPASSRQPRICDRSHGGCWDHTP